MWSFICFIMWFEHFLKNGLFLAQSLSVTQVPAHKQNMINDNLHISRWAVVFSVFLHWNNGCIVSGYKTANTRVWHFFSCGQSKYCSQKPTLLKKHLLIERNTEIKHCETVEMTLSTKITVQKKNLSTVDVKSFLRPEKDFRARCHVTYCVSVHSYWLNLLGCIKGVTDWQLSLLYK